MGWSLKYEVKPLFALGFQQQQKTWKQITPSSISQHVFCWFKKQGEQRQWQIFDFEKVDFDYIDILQTFSAAKIILEAYLEPSKTSPIKIFCGFLKETPP